MKKHISIPTEENFSVQREWARENGKLRSEWPGLETIKMIATKKKIRLYSEYVTGRVGGLNRAKSEAFVEHWLIDSPLHFQDIFGLVATEENIRTIFADLKKKALICAAVIPKHCDCKYCLKKKTLTAGKEVDTPVEDEDDDDIKSVIAEETARRGS